MSYQKEHFECASWRRVPEGFTGWSRFSGNTTRPFCDKGMGHTGDHEATVFANGSSKSQQMTWPNQTPNEVPIWLVGAVQWGLRVIRDHVYERDQTECEALDFALDQIDPYLNTYCGANDEEEDTK